MGSSNQDDTGSTSAETARDHALAEAAAKVEAVLDLSGEAVARPVLVVLSGLPGSGKSYLAQRLKPPLPAVIVETDYVRHILFSRPRHTGPESAWVYAVCHTLIARLLARSQSVIFDATNLIERNREVLYRLADRLQAKLVVVRTVAPDDVVRQRLSVRDKEPNPENHSEASVEVYVKMRHSEQPIRRTHVVVDTTQDIEQGVRRILRECRM